MEEFIKNLILKAIQRDPFLKEANIKKEEIEINVNQKENLGDYSSPICFLMAKKLKQDPQTLAQSLIDLINQNFKKEKKLFYLKALGGYLNFYLKNEALQSEFYNILALKENYGKIKISKNKVLVIDYSSPNIAKRFGIGHLRSTIIGYGLYNLYKFLGWKTIGDNHLGDWGTQFGKLLYQIKTKLLKNKSLKEQKKILNNLTIEKLEKLYVDFHKEAEKNPALEEEGRQWFKKLEEKDKEAVKIWKKCVEISLKEFNQIYKLLKVKFDVMLGESFYEEKMKEVVEELKKKKLVKESKGALIIEFEKDIPPAIVLKSDKTTTYFLRDLATIKYRLEKWKPKLILYEVGADQNLHFIQLFETVKLLKWTKKTKLAHINHGLMRWPWGKFSTRRGETIYFEDVLNELIKKALEIIEKSETKKGLSPKKKKEIAFKVSLNALKYYILSYHYQSDIVFNWDKILALEGNSGLYLQYCLTRGLSVLKKAKKVNLKQIKNYTPEPEEVLILRQLFKFKDVLKISAEKFSLNLLCDYLYELCSLYNRFYEKYPILKAENKEAREFRLGLTKALSIVLKTAFNILSIEILEKM